MDHRNKAEHTRAQRALKALEEELLAQSNLVLENRKELNVLIQQYEVGDSNPFGMTPAELSENVEKSLPPLQLRSSVYRRAKEAHEQSRAILREMKIKQQEARDLLSNFPGVITIHQLAQ